MGLRSTTPLLSSSCSITGSSMTTRMARYCSLSRTRTVAAFRSACGASSLKRWGHASAIRPNPNLHS